MQTAGNTDGLLCPMLDARRKWLEAQVRGPDDLWRWDRRFFEVKVDKVWVRIQKDGKHAIIKLAEGYSAEDVGSRVGVI